MITVLNICKGEALSWNNFPFFVRYITTWWWTVI